MKICFVELAEKGALQEMRGFEFHDVSPSFLTFFWKGGEVVAFATHRVQGFVISFEEKL